MERITDAQLAAADELAKAREEFLTEKTRDAFYRYVFANFIFRELCTLKEMA